MGDQIKAMPQPTPRSDLERLVKTGATPVALEGCEGLARMVLNQLGVQEPINSGGQATLLYKVLTHVIDEHMQHAVKRLRELPLREAGHHPSFKVAAAGELLRITNQELFEEAFIHLEPKICGTWPELRKKPHNQGVAEEFQLRAAIWVGTTTAKTGERRQGEFLAALESAIKVYLAKQRKNLKTLVLEHVLSDEPQGSTPTTSAASSSISHPIGVAGESMQAPQAPIDERVGKPISNYATNPLILGINPAIDLGADTAGLDKLPLYVPRAHDELLAGVVARATGGESIIATLVGEPSTGKTRACWEAVRNLEGQWRLWYPISPSEPEALLGGIARVGPQTVIWLNEVQRYLGVSLEGQQSAACLRELISDAVRAPVLILGTISRRDWMSLITKSAEHGLDPNYHMRALLAGSSIEVPDVFDSKNLADLRKAADKDPRLARAERMAPCGQITQYLAGVPEIENRYRTAPTVAKAVIHAAMDARRLRVSEDLPLEFFSRAVPGYLTDIQWNQAKTSWLEEALDWTDAPCKGVLGPLTRIKRRIHGTDSGPSRYRLADTLAQQGHTIREAELPPATFWEAAAIYMEPSSQATLARRAYEFGLFRLGAQLTKNSLHREWSVWAANDLIEVIANISPATLDDTISWAIRHIEITDIFVLPSLVRMLQEYQASDQLRLLFTQAAHKVSFNRADDVAHLISTLRDFDSPDALAILLARNPAAQVPLSNGSFGVEQLLETLRKVGASDQAEILAERVAADRRARKATPGDAVRQADITDTDSITRLLRDLHAEGATDQLHQLLERNLTSQVALDDLGKLGSLWKILYELKASEHVEKLAIRIAEYAENADSRWLTNLHIIAIELRFDDRLIALLPRKFPDSDLSQQNPHYVPWPWDNWKYVAWLWDNWAEPSDRAQIVEIVEYSVAKPEAFRHLSDLISLVDTLRQRDRKIADDMVARIATRASLTDPGFVAWLLGMLRELDLESEIATVLAKNPARTVSVDNAGQVASLLRELYLLGREDQITSLLNSRSVTNTVSLAHTNGVISLLEELDNLRRRDYVLALATRVASEIECNTTTYVVPLIKALYEIGALEQLAILTARIASELDLTRPRPLVKLLSTYQELGLKAEIAHLLSRDPVATLKRIRPVSASHDVADLLKILHTLGEDAQIKRLVARLATEAGFILLDDKGALASAMQTVGAYGELEALSKRAANFGQFHQYVTINSRAAQMFRFGREPDGSPSQAWDWHDLD